MDVLQRCRQLGFPPLIKTDKKIGELDSVTLLWLFYYLLEIYEPAWSHAPTAFTKSNYKPLSSSMRLLELGYKCPGSKQLKNPQKFEKSIISSLGAVLDKLEGKHGKHKLYSIRFEHPSIKGMQQKRNKKKMKENKALKENENVLNPIANQENIKKSQPGMIAKAQPKRQQNIENRQIQIPRATSKDVLCESTQRHRQHNNVQNEYYESKKQETETNNTPNYDKREEKAMEDVIMEGTKTMMNQNDEGCDLNEYNVKLPKYKNETVAFHFKMQKSENLSMAQRYEQLQIKQSEKMRKIHAMKDEYNRLRRQLNKCYAFHAKPFQDTQSTDYASFQLDSIRQKIEMEKNVKKERSVELMEEDGVDSMLDNLANQLKGWSNGHR